MMVSVCSYVLILRETWNLKLRLVFPVIPAKAGNQEKHWDRKTPGSRIESGMTARREVRDDGKRESPGMVLRCLL